MKKPGWFSASSLVLGLLVRAGELVFLVALFGFTACTRKAPETAEVQEPATPPPFKVVSVGEARSLPLAVASLLSGATSAPAGERFVTVGINFAPTVDVIETSRLFLLANDKLFPCRGIGNAEGRYCMMSSLTLQRARDSFTAPCGPSGAEPGSLPTFKTDQPTAAFAVPDTISVGALALSYTVPPPVATIAGAPAGARSLPNGFSARVLRTVEGALPGGELKQVFYVLDVKNNGRKAFRFHPGTIGLHVATRGAESAAGGGIWKAPNVGAIDMTGIGEHEMRQARPLTLLAAGEGRALGFNFVVAKDVDAKQSEIGFFREQVLGLSGFAAAPAPKK